MRGRGHMLTATIEAFLAQDHVAAFTTMRPDGRPHVAPVRFTWDPGSSTARVLTRAGTRKARNAAAGAGSVAVLCQTAGFRWVTLEGRVSLHTGAGRIARAVELYAARYAALPPEPPDRVVLEIDVEHVRSLNC
uniref:Oxidase-related FMN-binding protein n=1 Tax=uncultured bacterium BAC AB649/1850 TaxID=1037453 RepID=F6K0W9_9BACT|nr:oxidase-related FMN-binding protein [uncultured bacterium BAC AB649/1850]